MTDAGGEIPVWRAGVEGDVVRTAIVVPTYNHAEPLVRVLSELEQIGLPVIVVNDGSTDATADVLAKWAHEADVGLRVVVTLQPNRGKAAALRAGFAEALRRGCTHAATIDSDGQHDPADLRALIELSGKQPEAMIIGARRREGSSAPRASRWGRRLSNGMVKLESGVRVDDSQSGMRVYPLRTLGAWTGKAQRYGFETEVITRAGWHGVPVLETPIRCVYDVPGGRTTHFRIGGDTLASAGMHAQLLLGALKPGPLYGAEGKEVGRIPRRLMRWLSIFRLVRMARGDAVSRERLAASVGWGLVMATLPIYGLKTLVCLWLAGKLRLHPTAVLAVSSLSTPPVGLLFVALSIWTGAFALTGRPVDLSSVSLREAATWSGANTLMLEWLLGSVIAAPVLGLLGYGISRVLLLRGGSKVGPM